MTKELAKNEGPAAMSARDLGPAIQAAVALGAEGVETLRALQEIQERQDEREARSAFNAAVAELHGLLGSIPKNKTAAFKTRGGGNVQYRYADLHQIATHLRRYTGGLGLSWRWSTQHDDQGETVTCTLSHRLGHSESSTWRAPIESGNPMTSAPQKAKIATTFAQRVTLIQVFGLTDTDDDVDGTMPDNGGGERVSMEQEANLRALAEEVGADIGRFCGFMGIDVLGSLPASRLDDAVRALESKRGPA